MKDIKSVLSKVKQSKEVKKEDEKEETPKKVSGSAFWKQRAKASRK